MSPAAESLQGGLSFAGLPQTPELSLNQVSHLLWTRAGLGVGQSSSGRVSLGVHAEDPGNRQQYQEAEGGDHEGE